MWCGMKCNRLVKAASPWYYFWGQNPNTLNPKRPCCTADTPADRFWRKNTRPLLDDGSCVGVDLNRNWGVAFGGEERGSTCSRVHPSISYVEKRAFDGAHLVQMVDVRSPIPPKMYF